MSFIEINYRGKMEEFDDEDLLKLDYTVQDV